MILYCVRHGQSAYNAEGRIQGQRDVPLSPRGTAESAALADYFAAVELEAIYSSPLARARQTALAVGRRLGLEVRFDPRLMEIHAGIFQGLLWSEIRTRYPAEAEPWLAQAPDFEIPGGESRRHLGLRGREALEAIRAAGHGSVLVVSHGGLLVAALKLLLGIPAERNPFSLANAAICRARWEREFRLESLNERNHLAALDAQTPHARSADRGDEAANA